MLLLGIYRKETISWVPRGICSLFCKGFKSLISCHKRTAGSPWQGMPWGSQAPLFLLCRQQWPLFLGCARGQRKARRCYQQLCFCLVGQNQWYGDLTWKGVWESKRLSFQLLEWKTSVRGSWSELNEPSCKKYPRTYMFTYRKLFLLLLLSLLLF